MQAVDEGNAVPRTVAELGRIVQGSHKKGGVTLGRRARVALVAMLENPHRAAVQNISQLAGEVGVDPSTLTRLGQRLGFSGFSELQEVFRKEIAGRGQYYSSQGQGIIERAKPGKSSFVHSQAQEEVERLLETATAVNEDDIDIAAEMIKKAEAVHVLGLRATHSIAYFFGMFASFIRPRVSILGSSGAAIAEELAQIGPRDVLVAISFRPYTHQTIDACTAISKRRIPIIALTDISSPIAIDAEKRITIRARSPFYFNSAISGLFIAELLLSAVARKMGDDAIAHTAHVEALLQEMAIETE